ncbi:MAG: YggS family pyridoxal phosphate-dependent enzyme [Pseudomonadota bacterium]|nr:YggS family pyridoxal phosphate-dependent enzyme [Pseudomonadota bacterium]
MTTSAERLAAVAERIAAAARRSGRLPREVRLIAVSKTKTVQDIQSLADLGVKDFGENQIQEALGKLAQFRGTALDWHFIGHLQSNKCKFIPGNFSWVHCIDSEKLVKRIAQAARQADASVNLLLQVNVSADPAKHGVPSKDLFPLVECLLKQESGRTQLRGLMTIGYRGASEADRRRSFAALRHLLDQCQLRFGASMTELSMGMSGDFELAIEEGATMVRVGTALFGPRD